MSLFPHAAAAPDPEVVFVVAAAAPGGMGESIPLGAPVPVEQAVLETFFSHLGIFSYDKAKDNVEKEREANKSAGASWLSLLAGLAHLAAAEKAYHSMTFLGQKLGTAGPAHPRGRDPSPHAVPPSLLLGSPVLPFHSRLRSLLGVAAPAPAPGLPRV